MISEETVSQTWERMAQISPQEGRRYMHQMAQEQPAVLAYLMTLSGDPFNPDEMGGIFFIALTVWQMMQQSVHGLQSVSLETIEQAHEANFAFLERLFTTGDRGFEAATARMLAEYPEPEVLRYIVEAVEEDNGEEVFRDEYRGLAFVYLKTVLDAFIASPAQAASAGWMPGPL